MAIKVTIREKAISGNRKSLYLDFYPPVISNKTGEPTRREFLGMYLIEKPKNAIEKQHNKETIQLAEQIRQKRDNELNKPEIYTAYEREQLQMIEKGSRNFVEYFKKLAEKRKASNHDNWIATYKYLHEFTNGFLKFSDLNVAFCEDFKEYLLNTKSNRSNKTTLSNNSAVSYFNKFKATAKQAYKDGYLKDDINAKVSAIKTQETKRNYLTIEELNTLANTQCQNPLLKRVAIFSALTGLRFSDIQKLTWGAIEEIEGRYQINFIQQKTKGVEVLPISEQAFTLLGERKEPTRKIFEGLVYSAYHNKHLYQWLGASGITKDITFHCFRHTYATLQLSNGTDIYTVSKMLGHRDLKTTQIYAKVIDRAKQETTNKIKLDL